MTQFNDLPSRMNRSEDNIIDLRLAVSATLQAIDKNSEDIAQLIEVSRYTLEISRRNSEVISRHDEAISRHDETIATMNEAIRSIQASTEHTDRLLDYLIRRDQEQSQ
jgi:uncharacterized coiled-coil protein SlyX